MGLPLGEEVLLTHIGGSSLDPLIKSKLRTDPAKRSASNRTVDIALERVVRILDLGARKR